jgi:hypothetical protein
MIMGGVWRGTLWVTALHDNEALGLGWVLRGVW